MKYKVVKFVVEVILLFFLAILLIVKKWYAVSILAISILFYMVSDIYFCCKKIHTSFISCCVFKYIHIISNVFFNIGGVIWKGCLILSVFLFIVWLIYDKDVFFIYENCEIKDVITTLMTLLTVIVAYITYLKNNFSNKLHSYIELNYTLSKMVEEKLGSFYEQYKEFKSIYNICKGYDNDKDKRNLITKTAYDIFYFGDEWLSNRLNDNAISDYYRSQRLFEVKPKNEVLGVYYRNLYQSVQFIHNAWFLMKWQKKEYAKLVRTHISDYGQLMLYYNTFSYRGSAWRNENKHGVWLIEEYSMIENMPIIDIVGSPPNSIYRTIEFEYQKLRKSNKNGYNYGKD